MNSHSIPLCVDLDFTLIRSDILLESLLALFRQNPLSFIYLPFWLFKGKSYMKRQISKRVELDIVTLPYNDDVLEFLRKESALGREIILVTATDSYYAEGVAQNLGLFSKVISSDGVTNLKGMEKRKSLDALYGAGMYDYIGDDKSDIIIWEGARKAFLVCNDREKIPFRKNKIQFDQIFTVSLSQPLVKVWIRAFRIHQWAKNILIFVPLFLSHRLFDQQALVTVTIAFFVFSLVASANYLLNDLLDLDSDRQHPIKKTRAVASGDISIGYAVVAVFTLLGLAIGILFMLPYLFAEIVAVYLIATLLYSIFLKRIMIMDVIVLAGLYTIRIIAGTFVIDARLTFWLLLFSMFIFISLALIKRCSELELLRIASLDKMNNWVGQGRSYEVSDLGILTSLGIGSGLLSVLVFALYINSDEIRVLYQTPEVLWFALPVLLYWINRLWIITHRGLMNMDPVLYALQDRASQLSGLFLIIVLWLATFPF